MLRTIFSARSAATGIAGLLGILLIGGWGQDALYERRISNFREAVWSLESHVTAGVNRGEYRALVADARHEQLRSRARLSHWDIGRSSWGILNDALHSYEQAGSQWDEAISNRRANYSRRKDAEEAQQKAWEAASAGLHRADYRRRTWWWRDLPGSANPYLSFAR